MVDQEREEQPKPTEDELTGRVAGPQAVGVRKVSIDHPSVGITPATLAKLLYQSETGKPSQFFALAEEIEEKEPQYLATLGTRRRAVSQLDITVVPAEDVPGAEEHAALIQRFVDRACLSDELFDMLDAIGKGFSLTEIMWDTSDGVWLPKALKRVNPEWIEFDRTDLETPLIMNEGGPQPLQAYKFIPLSIKAKSGIPVRSGLARTVAWLWMFKSFTLKNWVQFITHYGHPTLIGQYGEGATASEKNALINTIIQILQTKAGVIPRGMELDLQQAASGATNGALFGDLADYIDKLISKAVLGQTMTTDDGASLSQAQVHSDVKDDIEKSDARQLANALNEYLTVSIIDFNFGPQRAYPKIMIGRAEHVDVPVYTAAVERMSNLGLPVSKTEVYSRLGWKKPEDADDVLRVQPSAAAGGNEDAESIATANRLNGLATCRADLDPDAIDDLAVISADASLENYQQQILKVIEDTADDVETFDEFREVILSRLIGADDGAFIDDVAGGLMVARGAGATGIDDEIDGIGPSDANIDA